MEGTLQLSVDTLEWAASKAGFSLLDFARTLYAKEAAVTSIALGRLSPAQLRKFAERAKVPFGFLLLPHPPSEYKVSQEITDFRTIKNEQPLSNDFLDVYKDVEHKRSWFRDYLVSIDAPKLEFVGKYKGEHSGDNELIAKDIRQTLRLDSIRDDIRSAEDYYTAIVRRCESVGVLVFKNSIVVNSTKRKLSLEEFRGFVISDDYAPAIFINGDDTKYANIFTLAHELAHIWLGESGISDIDIDSKNKEEVKCNAIAAEVLVPRRDFLNKWNHYDANYREKVTLLNRDFKVSELVVARVALTNKKISRAQYAAIHAEIIKFAMEKKRRDQDKNSMVPRAITLPMRNSRRITNTVLDLVKSNRMGPSQAAMLLNTSASAVFSL